MESRQSYQTDFYWDCHRPLLALIFPQASAISLLGQIFVGGLKAIAPLLVFTLVANALSQHQKGQKSNMKTVIILYLIGTFAAALVAVLANYVFPVTIELTAASSEVSPQKASAKF